MDKKYDLLIIGGGMAGLSAAVNAASEGLSTIVCDGSFQFGGQAGTSSLIENLLGFPQGITGADLTVKAVEQASKFNTEFRAPFNVVGLTQVNGYWVATGDDDETITAKAVLLAMGVTYRYLQAPGISRFVGNGVSYGSPSMSESFAGKTITIIGGANSAGQAAVYLSQCKDCHVKLLIRGNSLEDKMSTYLCEKITSADNIEVMVNTEVREAHGADKLDSVTITRKGVPETMHTDRLFVLIGAKPKTSWLRSTPIKLDENGYIITDDSLNVNSTLGYEEMVYGMFAAGDIRSGSVKRVSSALGEGSIAVNAVHKYIGEFNNNLQTHGTEVIL